MSSTLSNKCHVKGNRESGCDDVVGKKVGCNTERQKAVQRKERNTEVINYYIALLTAPQKRVSGSARKSVWYLPCWIGKLIEESELTYKEVYKHYMTEDKFGGPVTDCEKICLPMNWNRSHWYLAVVDVKAHEVFIYNSLPNESYNDMCLLYPRFDCGIYVMKYMEMLGDLKEGCTIMMNSKEARRSRAMELFYDTDNEARSACAMLVVLCCSHISNPELTIMARLPYNTDIVKEGGYLQGSTVDELHTEICEDLQRLMLEVDNVRTKMNEM
ncbi:hypothetical protein ACH5RR_012460 [Cinchona calisaya]|uniref:Ubiquitin-like protease family profile domain-containing protein n=1 Tax=Cinchona calisaya TaxID=153742 RepID=A0ABD3A7T3_9GENT